MQPENVAAVFLLGDDFDSILMKTAIYYAESGLSVWCIAPKSFEKIPKEIKPPDKEILKLITFLFLKDSASLIKNLNGIHLWHKKPDVIIVNGFEKYCDVNSESCNPCQAALLTTSILDAAATCAMKKNRKTFVLVTCKSAPDIPNNRLLGILQDLYFSKVVQKSQDGEDFREIVDFFK